MSLQIGVDTGKYLQINADTNYFQDEFQKISWKDDAEIFQIAQQ